MTRTRTEVAVQHVTEASEAAGRRSSSVPEDCLVATFDAVLFDLDGVIYRGPDLVAAADTSVQVLREGGKQAVFVTNNAARPPQAVADHLTEIGVPAAAADVVTSSQAAARLLAAQVEPASNVLVIGSEHLRDEVRRNGLHVVGSAEEQPVAVVQGYDPGLTMAELAEVAYAVQNGALWVATNTDPTRPTDRGLAPGAGTLVEAESWTVPGRSPQVAGKPQPALLQETLARVGTERALFVGDRLDTDIAGASSVGIAGVLVLTGSHGKHDLPAAVPEQRPAQVIADLSGLFEPARTASGDIESVQVGDARVRVVEGIVELSGPLDDVAQQLDGLWALASLCWARVDAGLALPDPHTALTLLDQVH